MKRKKQTMPRFYGLTQGDDWRFVEKAIKAIRRSLKGQKWRNNQHFIYQFELKSGILFGYQALETSELQNTALLTRTATEWVQQMKDLFEQRIWVKGLVIGVFYFDRWLNGVHDGLFFKWFLKDGELNPAQQESRGGVDREFSEDDLRQFDILQQYPLANGQYFVHFYQSGQAPQPDSDTLCLVQIVDSRIMFTRSAASKRIFNRLRPFITKEGPYRQIVIRYQHRHYNYSQKEFTYPVGDW